MRMQRRQVNWTHNYLAISLMILPNTILSAGGSALAKEMVIPQDSVKALGNLSKALSE